MVRETLHRFVEGGRRFAIDPETCFCFECDEISWDVLEFYPYSSVNRIYHQLGAKHSTKELEEVVGELEWLRATRAILPQRKREDLQKEVQLERGIKRITVQLPHETVESVSGKKGWFGAPATVVSSSARDIGREAIALLMGRSGDQKEVAIEFLEDNAVVNPELLADLCAHALKCGRLSGKKTTAAVRVCGVALGKAPEALDEHTISVKLEFSDEADILPQIKNLSRVGGESLARLAKVLHPDAPGVTGRIIVQPNHAEFGDVVRELDKAGFAAVELDLDGAYAAHPELDPRNMLAALRDTAVYYANRLLQQRYFRLDPIAPLFYRIYDGSPARRIDPAGTNELAVDRSGGIYPSWRLFGVGEFRLGSLAEGELNEDRRSRFDDVGSLTTGVCRRCWARNLCGGGNTAVHYALTGSHRTPHEPWCEAQRSWMASAVSAFNLLSTEGVNFTRVYNTLSRTAKPSLFTLVRAAFRMTIGMRPIEEADAEMLMQWENWNTAAYFLFNEKGILVTTKYDREMDALHPTGIDQEMILVKKSGSSFGLVKLRPEREPGAAQAWVFMKDEADYASDEVRKGFRAILKEAGGQQSIRRLTIPAAAHETGLQAFLEAVGFTREGTLREALFVHDAYHDVHLFGISTADL